MPTTKIDKVRRKLRELLPRWMKEEGRPPSYNEFLAEYRLRETLYTSEYSQAKLQVMKELGYAGDDNSSSSNGTVTNMAQANAKAEEKINRELTRAAKHLLPVMEKGRLEEVVFTLNPDSGKYEMEVQAAPPPRVKVEL